MEHRVICIGRQFGSGGHEIAVRVAERLGIKVYERELLHLACKYGELSAKLMEHSDERATNPFLYQGVYEGNYHVIRGLPTSEVLFTLQSHEIKRIAREEDCIFVGRCADYILRDHPRCINIFISSSMAERVKRLCAIHHISEEKAEEWIEKADSKRADYYNYYTFKQWGAAASYHLCMDSSQLGVEGTVEFIEGFVRRKLML